MKKYLAKFENVAAYDVFKASEDFVTPNVSWCTEENSMRFNKYRPFPIKGLTIVGDSTIDVNSTFTYTVIYSPAETPETGVTWSITSGSSYANIDSNTGEVTAIADGEVVICATSTVDSTIYAEKTITCKVHDYSQDYLTIVSTSDNNNISWNASNSSFIKTIKVSTNNGQTWTEKTSSTNGNILAVLNNGDKMLIKGDNDVYGSSSMYYNNFTSTGTFNIEGNIMSLIYEDNFIGQTALSERYNFLRLFYGCIGFTNAYALVLPATALKESCYMQMFMQCTNLITAPTLPATTLENAYSCYKQMFSDCSSLTTAPTLPATTLASSCYSSMFNGCSSLTTAPALPVTTLANKCYEGMFQNCTALTSAPTLPATTLTEYCYSSMFRGCTALTSAPTLPATTLIRSCYMQMFQNCSNLTYIKMLATDISASYCLASWVSGVAASGTFVKAAAQTSLPSGASGIPSGWTVQDAS